MNKQRKVLTTITYNEMGIIIDTKVEEVAQPNLQLATETISRQAAIDAFNTNLNELVVGGKENAKTVENYLNGVLDKIKCLPSALGTNLAEVGTDCISRQDALEAFGLSEKTRKYGGDHSGYDAMMMYEIQYTIENLPPIQPKRGKWIKTARWGRVYYCDQCRNYLDFDGVNAGRGSTNFCPNCGCRMDGGE